MSGVKSGTDIARTIDNPSLGDHVSKRVLFTPTTDPTPPAPTALLLFIQQAQMTLLYPERAEPKVDISPRISDLSDAA